ncbi:MAG: hypothetical protein E6J90_12625 [Deltaproteobacteria bacterium]|nr:MAG: hypothetical protein E6J90_12625 [Deltaproteobacteria bacterium]
MIAVGQGEQPAQQRPGRKMKTMPRGREVIDDRFTLEQLAGFGGMGHVYRARDQLSGSCVAVKVMHDAERLELGRFAREGQILATLSHPGIVRYIDSGITAEGEPYLVMEWLSGDTLAAHLQQLPLTLAVSAVHRRGVVHRDIKPSNLFLRGGAVDKAVLIDFGMARRPLADPKLTVTGTMLGTPGYISPEQVYNVPNLDGRSDLFSLGCVLYRCLSGRAPFRGPDALRILLNGTSEQLPRLRELRPSIPRPLDELVARLLARQPDDRPPNADVVASELLAIEEGDLGSLPRPRRSSSELPAERRLMCLVLARLAETARPFDGPDGPAQLRSLHELIEHHRGKLEILADGCLLVILCNADAAGDLAWRAARAALGLQRLLDDGTVAIVAGRQALGPGLADSELLGRAAALLDATDPATIRIDELTSALLRNRFDTAAGQLRGELRDADRMRLLFLEPVACIGRDHELEQLARIFEQCAEDRVASMVLVSGRDGIGKSRLGQEFLRRLKASGRPVEIWLGEADALSAGRAFGLLAQVVRRALGLDGHPIEVRRDKLRAWVERHAAAGAARHAEALGELVGTPFDGEEPGVLATPRQRRMLPSDELGEAFLSFLRIECAAQPVVIVLENLHWGDLPTIKLLYAALRALTAPRLLVLALARIQVHEIFPQLWADRCVQEIRLRRLPRRACEQLARHELGDTVGDDALKALVERAERHPAYLDELIRAAAEGKGAATPPTVLAMAQARLEKLDPAARRVLQAASTFGEVFWRDGVEALIGGDDTAAWLAVLLDQGMIAVKDDGGAGEVAYRFSHPLVREAAHEMLARDDRAADHPGAEQWSGH